ncbi:MAG: SRPBCC family protein [Acetobacteraceae bacterium]|nr:SRPBCC family protein [Acetobacteraceae bacterium]
MDITEQTRIAAPLEEVWPLLRDPQAVVACIPGAQLAPDSGDGVWRGSIRVKFGPTAAVFRGEATLDFDDAAHRCTIEGRGVDGRGASRALSTGTIEAAAEGEATRLTVQGSFSVSGPLETFANAGGVHLARALLAEFAENVTKLVAERRAAAPPPEPAAIAAPEPGPAVPPAAPPLPPARELSGAGLLWRALLFWFRSLLGRTR